MRMQRREYQMTEEDLAAFRAACTPTPNTVISAVPKNPAEASKEFWQLLGKRMGFKWWTAQPVRGKSPHYFTAIPYSLPELEELSHKASQRRLN